MKKFLAILAVAGVMVSCNNKKDDKPADKPNDTVVVKTDNPPATDPAPTTDGVPSFADADVQAYAQAYSDLADAYVKAAESKDMAKFTDLSKQAQDLATKGAAMSQKLAASPEDAKKLSDFIMAKSNQITEATKKLTGQ